MESAAFKKAYRQLNARQREAVDAIEGPVMVIAGPGTGKTAILTVRIANILTRTDTEPEAILALTYTVNGAAEMQRRLTELIGAPAHRVTITTFHGLCEQITREFEDRFAALSRRRLAGDAQRRRLMERVFASATYLDKLVSLGEDPYYVPHALRAIEELKREGVSADDLDRLISAERKAIADDPDAVSTRGKTKGKLKAEFLTRIERLDRLVELSRLFRDYEAALVREGLMEYTDLLTHVRDALKADEVLLRSLQERYQYLLVDEHQDTNSVQNRIVELLADYFESPNLFIVGDEKQAIYRFQGASLDNFLYFKDRFKGVRLVVLDENYRSSQLILDASHGIRASRTPLSAAAKHVAKPIRLYAAGSPDSQYFAVGRLIRERLNAGQNPGEIAVLYRRHADGSELAAMLARMDVPFTLQSQLDVMEDPDIRRLMLVLDAVRDFGEPGRLLDALHVPWLGVAPLDVYKLSKFCGRDRNPYDVIASLKLMREAHLTEPETLLQLSRRLAFWHTLARQESPTDALERIVTESGCLAALLAHPEGRQKIARLHAVYDVARNLVHGQRTATLMDLVDQLRYVRDKGIRLEASVPPAPGRVRLMTAHGAKGLEFTTVFIIDCYEKHWPSPSRTSPLALPDSVYRLRPGQDKGLADDEERNLFFVALTRAKEEVIISWPVRNARGDDLQASRYLDDLKPALTEAMDSGPLETAYSEQAHLRMTHVPVTVPELEDRDFLREQFVRHGLSATALNNYLACPWQFFYRNLIRYPGSLNVHLMYGNAVDRALELFFNARAAGEKATKALLVRLFSESAHDQPFSERALKVAVSRGTKTLSGWYDTWHASWPSKSLHQVRISGVPVPDLPEITINGKLDKMEFTGETAGTVRVVDYKTGKPKTPGEIAGTSKGGSGDYLRQLTFYRALLDRWHDGKYAMREGVLDFTDPDARGKYHRPVFEISREDADNLMKTVASVCREILDFSFWNSRCGERDCGYCPLRDSLHPS